MEVLTNLSLYKILPFFTCSFFTLSQMFLSSKDKILEKLENNNFTKNMIKHVNGFSKDNYTCSYYDDMGINNLYKKHIPSCLKMFHVNIESFYQHGTELSVYLKCLSLEFDIICLTEIRHTTRGIIEKDFPDFHIFIDDPSTAKGGVALLLRKNRFSQISEIDKNSDQHLKKTCNCTKCLIESKWINCKSNDLNIVIGGVYRHPNGDVDHFNNAMKNTISKINKNTLAIILGDINIDLIQENNSKVNAYLNNFLNTTLFLVLPYQLE